MGLLRQRELPPSDVSWAEPKDAHPGQDGEAKATCRVEGLLQAPQTPCPMAVVSLFLVSAALVDSIWSHFALSLVCVWLSLHLAESVPGQPCFSRGGHMVRNQPLSDGLNSNSVDSRGPGRGPKP